MFNPNYLLSVFNGNCPWRRKQRKKIWNGETEENLGYTLIIFFKFSFFPHTISYKIPQYTSDLLVYWATSRNLSSPLWIDLAINCWILHQMKKVDVGSHVFSREIKRVKDEKIYASKDTSYYSSRLLNNINVNLRRFA